MKEKIRPFLSVAFLKIIFSTKPNCAQDRRTIWLSYVPELRRQVFKHVKMLSEHSKEMKEQKNKRSILVVAESAYISKKAVWHRNVFKFKSHLDGL